MSVDWSAGMRKRSTATDNDACDDWEAAAKMWRQRCYENSDVIGELVCALTAASEELDEAGCQVAASQAHQAVRRAEQVATRFSAAPAP